MNKLPNRSDALILVTCSSPPLFRLFMVISNLDNFQYHVPSFLKCDFHLVHLTPRWSFRKFIFLYRTIFPYFPFFK